MIVELGTMFEIENSVMHDIHAVGTTNKQPPQNEQLTNLWQSWPFIFGGRERHGASFSVSQTTAAEGGYLRALKVRTRDHQYSASSFKVTTV